MKFSSNSLIFSVALTFESLTSSTTTGSLLRILRVCIPFFIFFDPVLLPAGAMFAEIE